MRVRAALAYVSLVAFVAGTFGAACWGWAIYRTPQLAETTVAGVPSPLVGLGSFLLLAALSGGTAGSYVERATGHGTAFDAIAWLFIVLCSFVLPPLGLVVGVASALPPLLGVLPWREIVRDDGDRRQRRFKRVGTHGVPLGAGRMVFALGVPILSGVYFVPQAVDAWVSGASWEEVERVLSVPAEPFVGSTCWRDADCARVGEGAFCDRGGWCSIPCDGLCPEAAPGRPPTFCIERADAPGDGRCVARHDARTNRGCERVVGSEPVSRPRFVGRSGAEPRSARVCLPPQSGE